MSAGQKKLISCKLPLAGGRGRIKNQNFMKSCALNKKFLGKLSFDTVGRILGAGDKAFLEKESMDGW